jgi:hypothetical protein
MKRICRFCVDFLFCYNSNSNCIYLKNKYGYPSISESERVDNFRAIKITFDEIELLRKNAVKKIEDGDL